MNKTDSPAEYYARKQRDYEIVIQLLAEHAVQHKLCGKSNDPCIVKGWLQKRLEEARYTGD